MVQIIEILILNLTEDIFFDFAPLNLCLKHYLKGDLGGKNE
jgi:hypothetical protein